MAEAPDAPSEQAQEWPPEVAGALRLLEEGDDDAVEERWKALGDAELDGAVAAYRGAVEAVSRELQARGVDVSLADERPREEAKAPRQTIPGVEGEEGVDFHFGSVDDVDPREWQVPPHCVPIHANVTTYDWRGLYTAAQFDVIMMDPPWQLATANPTRGVALGYSQLTDADIVGLPVPKLQSDGFLFVWVINAKYAFTLDLFERWGYELVDEVVWVKMTVNRRLAKSHGYYLQHAKEVCLVGRKGRDPARLAPSAGCDVIYSERRGQSQKPEEIYQLIERLVPGGKYLEIFGRKNNLRDHWVTVGNEVTGTGLPQEDVEALKQRNCIPGAVYGAAGR